MWSTHKKENGSGEHGVEWPKESQTPKGQPSQPPREVFQPSLRPRCLVHSEKSEIGNDDRQTHKIEKIEG